jgi:hypothetical protein
MIYGMADVITGLVRMYDSSNRVCHQCDHPLPFDFIGTAQSRRLRTNIREVPISANDIDNGLLLYMNY